MFYKLLILIISVLAVTAQAQEEAATPPVSPIQAALESARESVRQGDADSAVETLEALAAGGFTAVGVITGDNELATLEGHEGYDSLVAQMTIAAFPCEHDSRFQEFDFWVGNWEVHVGNGTFVGRNTIESAERGCVLIENWISASGGTGMSINYLDEATGEWVQVWNSSSGSQINIRGGLTEDGMLLEGTIHYVATDQTAPFRGLWTPLEDGRVRQYFEQGNAEGTEWSPWFEGFYTRVGTDATAD